MFRELGIGEEASKFKHVAYLIPFIMVFVYDAFYKSSLAKNTRVATITSFMGIAGVLCLLICVSEMTSYRAYNIHLGTMYGTEFGRRNNGLLLPSKMVMRRIRLMREWQAYVLNIIHICPCL
jgi:hypothetical protein